MHNFRWAQEFVNGITQYYDLVEDSKKKEIEEFLRSKAVREVNPGKVLVKKIMFKSNTMNIRHWAVIYYLWQNYQNQDEHTRPQKTHFSQIEALTLALMPSPNTDGSENVRSPMHEIESYTVALCYGAQHFPQHFEYRIIPPADCENASHIREC